jgi:ParB family transcriptional regulator, chromosome partitioning protein
MAARTNLASLFGEDPGHNPVIGVSAPPGSHNRVIGKRHRAPLEHLAFNPDNPRESLETDPEIRELAESLRQVGQLQPAVAVTAPVYLKHFPQHAATIGDARWVVINGNRRLAAAAAAELPALEITVRDDLADGDGLIDEAVMIENVHRKRLDPIREARFIQRMIERHGSQAKVAERIGKTQAFVSQRLALLSLPVEVQTKVSAGELRVKEARRLAVRGGESVHDRSVSRQRPAVIPVGAVPEIATALRAHLSQDDLAALVELLRSGL